MNFFLWAMVNVSRHGSRLFANGFKVAYITPPSDPSVHTKCNCIDLLVNL